ncbi:MAG: RDD family protein [Campylobacterales bacterium]|nr:RDD family protein [Campylobacterales bacterium]
MRHRTLKKNKKISLSAPQKIAYAPFWSRALGLITDIFMIGLPISLIIIFLFGYDQTHTAGGMDVLMQNKEALKNPPNPLGSLTQLLLFMSVTVVMWHKSGQTPGKKMAHTRVVDAHTLQNAPYWKLILRFIGYFISLITLVGFFIGLLRRDKRTLHDLLSGTAVIRVL